MDSKFKLRLKLFNNYLKLSHKWVLERQQFSNKFLNKLMCSLKFKHKHRKLPSLWHKLQSNQLPYRVISQHHNNK